MPHRPRVVPLSALPAARTETLLPGASGLAVRTGGQRRGEGIKRVVDLAGATLAILLFALPMLAIALAIRLRMGPPALFRAVRAGRYGQPFVLYKFRTMLDRRDASGQLLPDGERITRLGRFLRRTSLDELPQLFNVLRGEMSLVGPRPLLMEYLERYTPEQARRLEVRPGMTGWPQVNGRNTLSWEDKFALDVWYVDHASLPLDLGILARTVLKVIARQDISAEGDVDVPAFTGTGGFARPGGEAATLQARGVEGGREGGAPARGGAAAPGDETIHHEGRAR